MAMTSHPGSVSRPKGLRRLLLRVPIWLYRTKLSNPLSRRFILLHHVGRRSGQLRQAVVEILAEDPDTGAVLVASGFGEQSEWLRNVTRHPHVVLQRGERLYAARAVRLPPEGCGLALADFAQRRPRDARRLLRFFGHPDIESPDYFTIGRDFIPFVALIPTLPWRRPEPRVGRRTAMS